MNSNIILYTSDGRDVSVQVQYEDGTFWLTQKRMAELFGVNVRTISEHLSNLYQSHEIQDERTIRKIRIVQTEDPREVEREHEMFRRRQDIEYVSDFDKEVKRLKGEI